MKTILTTGAVDADDRGRTIWDTFSHTDKKVFLNQNGDVACDHYNRYKEDVQLIKSLGLKHYRFSIAWARIYPEGKGEVNPKGLAFYNSLVDELLAAGVEPYVTLYHWVNILLVYIPIPYISNYASRICLFM